MTPESSLINRPVPFCGAVPPAAHEDFPAARNVKNAGLPKIVAGKLKRDDQESAGHSDEVHAARVNDARATIVAPTG